MSARAISRHLVIFRRFGRFSNIRDFGLVGSGDIRLEHKQRYNLLERAGRTIFMSELDYFLFDKI